ncbi:MAG: SRPBCC family protein [Acidimicrobiales bacterium]|nr:SRPBCC family protein [Acidimicrobiales bacterium]
MRIARSADDVWALVGDAAALAGWFPGITWSTVDGDVRRIGLASGLELVEQIVTCDPELRRFQYRITGGVPVSRHLATVDVFELGPADSLVAYSTEVEPAPLVLVLGAAVAAALANLETMLETG